MIFITLGHLQDIWKRSGRAGGSLQPVVSLVEQLWVERCAAVGVMELSEKARCAATWLADEFIAILDDQVVRNRYSNTSGARTVFLWLVGKGPGPANPSLIDLLNGGWWPGDTSNRSSGAIG